LRLYALLEGAVGLFCLATPWLFELIESAYVALHPALQASPLLVRLARFGLSMLVLLPPTMLMGGTLPALTRALMRRLDDLGSHVATLYGTNTIGAMLGAVAGGFLLIPAVGMRQSIYLTAVLNLAIALVTWALSVAWERASPVREALAVQAQPLARPRPGYLWLLVAYGCAGAASMVYEVGWTRVLSLSIGTSTYAFSLMLAAFLAGIGLGSITLARRGPVGVDRLRDPLMAFGLVEVGIALLATALTPALDRLPFTFLALYRAVGPRFWLLQGGGLLVAFVVMLAPALLMGYAFPLVTRLATESLGVVGRRVGSVYAANTLGTVIGSFAAGFVLIPALGARWALAVGVGLNLLVGAGYAVSALRRAPRLAALGLAAAGLTVVAWLVLPGWNRSVLTAGVYVYPYFYLSGDPVQIMHEKEVLYYRDATTATVSVTRVELPGHDAPMISLQINGKTDASTGDLSTQLVLAHLPGLLRPQARSALVVGLASGCTLGAVTLYPGLERIDCVEIEPAMVTASEHFRHINRDCLSDPRVRLILEDARNALLVSDTTYDFITSEPSNPWISGVANLFTREYFELCRTHLSEDGLLCQWLPLYNLTPRDLASILGTFGDVFPECSLWLFPTLTTDAFLVGSRGPLHIDVVAAEQAARGEVLTDLRLAGLGDLWGLLGGYLFGSDLIARLSEQATRHTDDFPILEFTTPMALHTTTPQFSSQEVLLLAMRSTVPVGRCVRAVDGAYEDALSGLQVGPPWSEPEQASLTVQRDPAAWVRHEPTAGLGGRARVRWRLGAGRADILTSVRGLGPERAVPGQPEQPPDGIIPMGEAGAQVWTGPGLPNDARWIARWSCPEQDRIYLIVAHAGAGEPAPPEQALRGLRPLRTVRERAGAP
ncbi:MAG: fused MFS/spermidine synthase, partial [Armatimonadota bacterium]